jgi:hypothetical protein
MVQDGRQRTTVCSTRIGTTVQTHRMHNTNWDMHGQATGCFGLAAQNDARRLVETGRACAPKMIDTSGVSVGASTSSQSHSQKRRAYLARLALRQTTSQILHHNLHHIAPFDTHRKPSTCIEPTACAPRERPRRRRSRTRPLRRPRQRAVVSSERPISVRHATNLCGRSILSVLSSGSGCLR